MSFDLETLYNLLPAVYRIRDLEQVATLPGALQSPGDTSIQLPLKALLAVITGQISILEDNLAQLYDDQFIETCAPWVIPYIGDLVGYNTPHDTSSQSLRSEVAHTIGYRKRKGTAALIEQLARDVTGWDAHVVEFFQVMAATQHMNRFRSTINLVDLRDGVSLNRLNTPFDSLAHRVDTRNIAAGRGSYNIPNIGIFIWRLEAYPLTRTSASPAAAGDDQRYFFSPLGSNMPLFTHPIVQTDLTQLADPRNVATPIYPGELKHFLSDYYGPGKSFLLTVDIGDNRDVDILPGPDYKLDDLFIVTDLGDWKNLPSEKIAVDPISGRFAFPEDISSLLARMGLSPTARVFTNVRSAFYYGFSAEMGGGEYHRAASFTGGLKSYTSVPADLVAIQQALDALTIPSDPVKPPTDGVVEITDSRRIEGVLSITAAANQRIELRAADFCRPLLKLEDSTKPPEMLITGEAGSQVTLNGLVISHGSLRVSGNLERMVLRHCTLVPGRSLSEQGKPHSLEPALIIESPLTQVEIDHSIVGSLQVIESAAVDINNSIVDATGKHHTAYTGTTVSEHGVRSHGSAMRVENSTIIGKVHTASMELASNTIFFSQGGVPLDVTKRQEGCVRFSFVPDNSRTPRRYQCQPEKEGQAQQVEPRFTSSRYGTPGYCQLLRRAPVEARREAGSGKQPLPGSAYDILVREQVENEAKIRQGADDGAEMGAFHDLFQPQRETNLRLRLAEYLRFTLEPGIIYIT